MNPATRDGTALPNGKAQATQYAPAEVLPIRPEASGRESLSENFNREIDAWARHALASNGFADALI